MMKVLCVCSRGNSRSVALGWMLKDGMAFDAIAMGIDANSEDTKNMLYDWADHIIIVDRELLDKFPERYKNKLKVFDVGGDRFFRGFEPELIDIYKKYLINEGWIIERGDM